MKSAENQQIASSLSVKLHAPGKAVLSDENYDLCQSLLEQITLFLPEDQIICLKAQCVASFTGKWPICLNMDSCLTTPEKAALVVMSCEDEKLIHQIIEAFPDSQKVNQAYGLHALKFGKNDGTAYVEKALQLDVSNPMNHALLAFLNRNEPDVALNSLETALHYWPDESEWHAIAGDLYHQIGNTALASQHIASALEKDPKNAGYWHKSAEIKLNCNELEKAKKDLEKSATLYSENPQIWKKMAEVNRRLGNISSAIEDIEKARKLAPDDKDVAIQEYNYLFELRRYKDAENKAREILEINRTDEDGLILLARAQTKQGEFDLALSGLTSISTKYPDNVNIRLEIIRIRKERDGTEAVLPDLINLAKEYSEDANTLTTLTDYLIQTNRLKEAEEAAQTILRIVPEQAEVHLMLGRLQRKTGQLDQAIAHFSDAIHYDPLLLEAYLELGKTYQERRELAKAIETFQKGTQADNSDPRPYFHAGMALKDCKDYAGAETMLKQAKKFAPDDPIIIRQLGIITALNLVNHLRESR